jgi:hypothetical protein
MTENENEGASPYGHPYGQPYGQDQQPYAQPAYQPAPTYDQQQPPQYGQYPSQAYGQYPSQAYGQQAPAQGGYGPPAYPQYAPAEPAPRPTGVMTASVLGFVWGALGAIATVILMAGGAFFSGASGSADNTLPGLGTVAGAAAGVFIFLGVLALAWTVVMFWGSAWALSGRSRVLLLVGGSISIATTGFAFFGSLDGNSTAGGIILSLLLFVLSIAMVVLLARKDAAAFYAYQRSLRTGR